MPAPIDQPQHATKGTGAFTSHFKNLQRQTEKKRSIEKSRKNVIADLKYDN